jgi:hypothetical protein
VDGIGRVIPLESFDALRARIDDGVLPWERYWIDYKRQLYRGEGGLPASGKSKPKDHAELARDMASMSVQGGYLVYGVEEDNEAQTYTTVGTRWPSGIRETIVGVAQDRISPPLYVEVTPLPNPHAGVGEVDSPGGGLLVVYVPPSADAPHQVEGTYYGRTDTGKTTLDDRRVEALMQQRRQFGQRVNDALQALIDADPASPAVRIGARDVPHLHFVAVPDRPEPDMFTRYTTTDRNSIQQLFMRLLNNTVDVSPRSPKICAFQGLIDNRRVVDGARWTTWPNQEFRDGGVEIGIGDAGLVRLTQFAIGTAPGQRIPDGALAGGDWPGDVYLGTARYLVIDMIRLLTALSAEIGYTAGWQVAVHVDRLRGRVAYRGGGYWPGLSTGYNGDQFSCTVSITPRQLQADPTVIANQLLLPLFRDFSAENLIPGSSTVTRP